MNRLFTSVHVGEDRMPVFLSGHHRKALGTYHSLGNQEDPGLDY